MGDRFYEQQLKATGKAPGKKNQAEPKLLKADVLTELPELKGLAKLTMKDLQVLKSTDCLTKKHTLIMPEGRLKAPYVAQVKQINSDVSWDKLTIAELKEIITLFA